LRAGARAPPRAVRRAVVRHRAARSGGARPAAAAPARRHRRRPRRHRARHAARHLDRRRAPRSRPGSGDRTRHARRGRPRPGRRRVVPRHRRGGAPALHGPLLGHRRADRGDPMTEQEPQTAPDRRAARRRRSSWVPFVAVAAVVAIVVGVLVVTGGDDGADEPASADTAGPDGGTPPYLSWTDADPLDAPDCDPETGRIRVPIYTAPNCVPEWDDDADNGGATWQGVTADTITVVVYQSQDPLADALRSQVDVQDET